MKRVRWQIARAHWGLMILVSAVILASNGCGRPSQGGGDQASQVPRLDTGQLPPLGDVLPPLDGGRLELSPPQEWVVSPRSTQYIVRFQADQGNPYPSVLVTAKDCPQVKSLTSDSLPLFARLVASELESAGVKTTVKPGRIGDHLGVMYTRRARVKDALGGIVERVFFDTVVNGRRYQFELRCPPETVGLAEPYLLAVVKGAKLVGVGEIPEEELTAASEAAAEGGEAPTTGKQPSPVISEKAAETAQKGSKPVAQAKPAEKPLAQAGAVGKEEQPRPTSEATSPAQAAADQKAPVEKAPEKPSAVETPQSKPEPSKKGKSAEDLLKDVDSLLK